MKERPILFSGPMVRALLEGKKTQTRRAVSPQPLNDPRIGMVNAGYCGNPDLWMVNGSVFLYGRNAAPQWRCPYGRPGDRLWSRETFWAFGRWETRYSAKKGRDEWHFVDMTLDSGHFYLYDAPTGWKRPTRAGAIPAWWKRPAIFMPRIASRIWNEVVSVRVERLQDISEADAVAEGIYAEVVIVGANCNGGVHREESEERYFFDGCADEGFESAIDAYAALWDSINGQGAWDANPWVWVMEFVRVYVELK